MNFNSHTPCGVRPESHSTEKIINIFQLTHPMWGATQQTEINDITDIISTHTPHVGCDPLHHLPHLHPQAFQLTHPMWGATLGGDKMEKEYEFQLTHPMWGATEKSFRAKTVLEFQLTHPMWGATLDFVKKIRTALYMLGWTYEILLFKIKIYANYAANLSQYSYYYRFA